MEPDKFQMFINLLNVRAKDLGMLTVGGNAMVPIDITNPGSSTINSIADYGRTNLEQVTA